MTGAFQYLFNEKVTQGGSRPGEIGKEGVRRVSNNTKHKD